MNPLAAEPISRPRKVSDRSMPPRAAGAVKRATKALLAEQSPEGYWCAELEGDSILQGEYILLKWILGQEDDPRLPRIANHLRSQQRHEDGAWVQYPGAAPDASATVKAYFALKLMGEDVDAPHMSRARDLVRRIGGAEACNTYSRFYLAALGQLSYENVPAVPPELALLPRWFFFHLDKISAWSRTMIMPLAIVWHHRPCRSLPADQCISELFLRPDRAQFPCTHFAPGGPSWANLFIAADKALKLWQRTGFTPLRRAALARVERWIDRRTDPQDTDGLGAIFPPMVYVILAYRCLGYDLDDPRVVEAMEQLDRLMIEERDAIRIQPCLSPVWDSGIATFALADAGLDADHPGVKRAADWLISKECRQAGDWQNNLRQKIEPGGWYFEFNNAWYPDVDDTAMVAMALKRTTDDPAASAASNRGVDWLLAMQNEDGGWAAFDRTASRPLLEHIPFADHNAIQDPSCPDIAGRAIECLGHHGLGPDDAPVARALDFLQATQEPEGCWFGRWGVNYVYGTWQVLCGLASVGADMESPSVRSAGQWLRHVQHTDGSFGESADSYHDVSARGRGPATASQTAWGTMGLMAVYGPADPAVHRGIAWLLDQQRADGDWKETQFTGTGFPRVFYLRYHLYRLYFPLMCLGRWSRLSSGG